MSGIDPIRPVSSLPSGRSAKSRLCELELYKAAVGDLTQSANCCHSTCILSGRSIGRSTLESVVQKVRGGATEWGRTRSMTDEQMKDLTAHLRAGLALRGWGGFVFTAPPTR